MTTENNTTQAHAATFAQFLIEKNSTTDEIGNFHCTFGDHGFEFPASASEFIEAASMGTTGDSELQYNIETFAYIMRQVSDYLLMALDEHRKIAQGEAV